jgi:ribosomal protein L31E
MMAAAEFAIPVTRNKGSRRDNRAQSIVSIVAKVLARNHFNLDETTVGRTGARIGDRDAAERIPTNPRICGVMTPC